MCSLLRLISLFLPVLFPSWRFFRAVEPSPRIELLRDGGWVEHHPRPEQISLARQVRRMIWNPHWNRYLYSVSLSERLIIEPTQHSLEGLHQMLADDMGQIPPFRINFVCEEAGQIVGTIEYESDVGQGI